MSTLVDATKAGLTAAAEAIAAGKPVVLPTDTVYGLAVIAGDADALDLVFQLKRRPAERSVAVLVADVDQASQIANLNPFERQAASNCWPGALTLVLQRRDTIDPSIGRDDGTVGVRCPNHAFVRELARQVGPLATTSANLSGGPTPVLALDAADALDGEVAVVVDGGPCTGHASTVAKIAATGELTIFRQGSLVEADLRAALAL